MPREAVRRRTFSVRHRGALGHGMDEAPQVLMEHVPQLSQRGIDAWAHVDAITGRAHAADVVDHALPSALFRRHHAQAPARACRSPRARVLRGHRGTDSARTFAIAAAQPAW